ncbi:hypothetical protein AALO_G00138900 [Alosa alosa]|uniref:Uncharacterized protein n=1 Tax=Alosa alosa TaxID=278164 RepID=A0AAV6GJM5_9TELE|nr:hypothetical protein AALO_G00138900 [Alosa alosa]
MIQKGGRAWSTTNPKRAHVTRCSSSYTGYLWLPKIKFKSLTLAYKVTTVNDTKIANADQPFVAVATSEDEQRVLQVILDFSLASDHSIYEKSRGVLLSHSRESSGPEGDSQ